MLRSPLFLSTLTLSDAAIEGTRPSFEVPSGDASRTLSLVQDTSRPIDFDVSGAK